MIGVTIYLTSCWLMRVGRREAGLKDIGELTECLRLIRGEIRSGGLDWRPVGSRCELPLAIGQVIEAAWLQGKPLDDSLGCLAGQLDEARKVGREQLVVSRLYWSRGGLIGLVALGVILLQPEGNYNWSDYAEQLVSGSLAAGVFVAGAMAIRLAGIRPWVTADGQISEAVSSWLASHIDGESRSGWAWSESIEVLTVREFSQGISLLTEKRRVLEDWSEEQLLSVRQRLSMVTDLLPVAELLGVGVPLIILIFQFVK